MWKKAFREIPEVFISRWLEKLATPLLPLYREAADEGVVVGLIIQGEGGGEWTLDLDQRELFVSPGKEGTPLFSIEGEAADWSRISPQLALVYEGALSEAASGFALPEASRLTRRRLNALRRLKGRLRLEITDFDQSSVKPVVVELVLNGWTGSTPPLVVRLGRRVLESLVRDRAPLSELFSTHGVEVSGDLGLALKLGLALA